MKKVLIVNTFGIGDLLFSTPLINILKNSKEDIEISYICNKRAASILEGDEAVKNVFVFEKDDFRVLWAKSKIGFMKEFFSFLNKLKKKKFDIVFDLSLSPKYGYFLKLLGIPKRIGFDYKKRGKFLTHKISIDGFSDKHVVEYNCDLLKLIGIENIKPEDKKMRMLIFDKEIKWAEKFLKDNGLKNNELIFGVVPGCGVSWGQNAVYRRWDRSRFAELADKISENFGYKAIIFGDFNEIEIEKYISDNMKHKPILACGKTDLKELAALLRRCEFLVCNDGGIHHIAVSQDVPTISIFGPVDEKVYGPYPISPRNIVLKKDLNCRPCYKRFKHKECKTKDCLNLIEVDDVYRVVESFIKGNKR